ncbi:hypothetical protein COCC4DRAFT_148444 [Bipolaris maydis ATCC 48331]|uniref:Uncharacterized protein n=1 Tax=Cochliobolus heterostrophus (strain C4 / ATCC 48331 / race T) TaxID=665024 RepID=N4X7N1_COCH4|nr:uncharacterized protein COCC4DRAFT_148444 [Bipolaris maydis ATCC 48331]ENI01262.1 hypothetical protein COCC4DRAFT_148444 [Bipolaris maydis ATCC 48331]
MLLRSRRVVREMTSLLIELVALVKRRARNITKQKQHYCRQLLQPDLSADDVDTM